MELENQNPEATQPSTPQTEETQPARIPPADALDSTRPVSIGAQPETEQTAPTPVAPPPAEVTQAAKIAPPSSPETPAAPRKRNLAWLAWTFLGLLLLGLIAVASGYAGYLSAIERRTTFASTQVAGDAQTQFDLGVQDLEAGRYDLARQRFEYVIQLNPGFPGVTEKLAETLMHINTTATPTVEPTPTLTPTPDLRSQEVIFEQAQTQLASGDWTGAIDTLLTLRKRYPDHRAVEVDGMLFVALRNRGVEKISLRADLEGGIYDLALAERFGPVDVEANNWRDWAELYVRGASFWDVDWEQAVFYFGQLAQIAPNLTDGSGYTSSERYRLALIGYGDWLARQERWCDAQEQYDRSNNLSPREELRPTAEYAADQCANPTSEPQSEAPTATLQTNLTPTPPTDLPTPTPTTPVEEPTPTPTEEVIPTETPTETPVT